MAKKKFIYTQYDYHRRQEGAYSLYKTLKSLNEFDMKSLWTYMTNDPKNNTIIDRCRFSYLKEDKYDLMRELETKLLSPFVMKYLLVKYGTRPGEQFRNIL